MANSTPFFNNWLEHQAQWMKTWQDMVNPTPSTGTERAASAGDAPPDDTTYGTHAASEWLKTYLEAFQRFQHSTEEQYWQWADWQHQQMKQWQDTLEKSQKAFGDFVPKDTTTAAQAWLNTLWKSMDQMTKAVSGNLQKGMVENVLSSMDAYAKVFNLWLPLQHDILNKSFDPERYKALFRPEAYQPVMDRIFEFISPDATKEVYTQTLNLWQQVMGSGHATVARLAEMMAHAMKSIPSLMVTDPSSAVAVMDHLNQAYKAAMSPLLNDASGHLFPAEQMTAIYEKYQAYTRRFAEFQQMIYTHGQRALEQVADRVAEMIKAGDDISTYDAFFKLWLDTNETVFLDLFETQEFSTLQNQLLEEGLALRAELQKWMEQTLAGYPVVLRSEMDELYKTVQDLKRKVNSLEKQMKTKTKAKKKD